MGDLRRIKTSVANLLDRPNGALQRQLLCGEAFEVTGKESGFAIGHRQSDGYKGAIADQDLANWADPTNRVRDLGAHVYAEPDFKTIPISHLPYQAELTVVGEAGEFAELAAGGYVHQMQIETIATFEPDYVRTAERYLGVPYLWGGNSQYGIDCSGLVSAALRGANIRCAADSSDQEKTIGEVIPAGNDLQRGDIVFWKGHVGVMYSEALLLHANAYHMKVAFEPLEEAVNRINKSGGGEITACKRL